MNNQLTWFADMEIVEWVRPNIAELKPYSSARDEFTGDASVFLDANENPFNQPVNRYPDPLQRELKNKLSVLKSVPAGNIFLGNGSDEAVDLIIRTFCEPRVHDIVQFEPTYGMYRVAAGINNVEVKSVLLSDGFQPDAGILLRAVTTDTRAVFLCSPNNPTGNGIDRQVVREILNSFPGPVILDEAYIDFAPSLSWLPDLAKFPNLIILQTLSKAWGMAGIRLGMAFAHPAVISIFNKIKYPYNVNILTQKKAIEQLDHQEQKEKWVATILRERDTLATSLIRLPAVEKVWPSDANFLLVKMKNARQVYDFLSSRGIIVRDRSKIPLCENCLRITVGTPEENKKLIDALYELNQNKE